MKRDYPFTVAVILLAIVLLAIAMILWSRATKQNAEIESLRGELAAVEETQTGGAETRSPQIKPSAGRYRFPIAPEDYLRMTSPFGYRLSPVANVERYHNGLDIAATWRAQVVAVADGEVVEHWPPPDGYYKGHPVHGGMIVLQHENGWRSVYSHLSDTRVHTGWIVRSGEAIGRVGNTGQSDGAHLHVEIHDATGRPVNPLLYLEVDLHKE